MSNKLVKRSVHICVDVNGYLRSFQTKKSQGADMKTYQTLLLARYNGYKVIPIGDKCNRFSYEEGCKGHITSIMPTEV